MTSTSVTSIKKAISRLLEDSAQFTTQQKSESQLIVREDFEQLSIDSINRPDDRATSSKHYSLFEKILNYAADMFGEDI
jgi:hypothetical protein